MNYAVRWSYGGFQRIILSEDISDTFRNCGFVFSGEEAWWIVDSVEKYYEGGCYAFGTVV